MLDTKVSSVVEDYGQYSFKGGIFDIFSPAHKYPVRIELFGETIESLRFFDVENQRSILKRRLKYILLFFLLVKLSSKQKIIPHFFLI